MGVLNEHNFIFKPSYTKQIGEFVSENQDTMREVLDQKYVEIFRAHPGKTDFDAETVITKIIKDRRKIMPHSRSPLNSITGSEGQQTTSAGRTRYAKGATRTSGSTSPGQQQNWATT
jgi:hypothetical protein